MRIKQINSTVKQGEDMVGFGMRGKRSKTDPEPGAPVGPLRLPASYMKPDSIPQYWNVGIRHPSRYSKNQLH